MFKHCFIQHSVKTEAMALSLLILNGYRFYYILPTLRVRQQFCDSHFRDLNGNEHFSQGTKHKD